MNPLIIRSRIKECMEENEDTAATLSKKLGINRSTITRWFNGDTDSIKSEFLMRISKLYNVNIGWLLGIEGEGKTVEPELLKSARKEVYDMLKNVSMEDIQRIKQMINLMLGK